MELIVNAPAVASSSRGVRRYTDAVMRHLRWPEGIEMLAAGRSRSLARPRELLYRGRRDVVLWTPCQRGPLWAHNHVVTVHDCINVEYVYARDWRLSAYKRLFNAILNNAAAIVAISAATKSAILRNYAVDDARIQVVRSGEDAFATPTEDVMPVDATAAPPFILMVINSLPHKNAVMACSALASSKAVAERIPVRIVGDLPESAVAACRKAGVVLEVHQAVDDRALRHWYRTCRFLCSPSLDEGHNLPIAEALACGARILCSDIPVHREYYQGRVVFFDPRRRDSMVDALDAAIAGSIEWPPALAADSRRSFAEVARDYESIFTAVGRHATTR